jgi:hypothetical protein
MVQESLQHPIQMCIIKQATLGARAGMFGACALAIFKEKYQNFS